MGGGGSFASKAGLRAALRRILEARPAAVPSLGPGSAVPRPAPLSLHEEEFPVKGRYPEELFGSDFRLEGIGEAIAFLDVETCGLADEPIFLIGILRPESSGLRFLRALAEDPSGEPALLRWGAEVLRSPQVWVTFNGRSFDGPRLRRRAALHGIDFPLPAEHRDLLGEVRRRYRHALPDCRLSTVERRLLGLERLPCDVPGREVPLRYWDFVRTGDRRWIIPVLEHNRRDVTAMAVLLRRLREPE